MTHYLSEDDWEQLALDQRGSRTAGRRPEASTPGERVRGQ